MMKSGLIILFCFIVVLAGLLMRGWLYFGGCNDAILQQKQSPDKSYHVTVFERDCGATTDFSTIVNIQRPHKRFDPKRGSNVLVIKGRSSIELSWPPQGGLDVSYSTGEVFKSDTLWNGARIQCKHQ
jgi:hypothetical protein